MVAKIICGPDADDMYNFYKGEKDPGLCEKCKTRLKMIPNLNYQVRIKGRDFQNTYDGYYIVSERFKVIILICLSFQQKQKGIIYSYHKRFTKRQVK